MPSKWDLANWQTGKVSLFQALGIKGAIYPSFTPRLLAGSVVNNPGPASIGQLSTTPQSANGQGTSTQGLHNPIGPGLIPGRVDEGKDYSGAGPLYAIGDGTITNVYNKGWPGGVYILLHLDQGQYVYYAENLSPQVRVNQKVKAGDIVGYAKGSYPYIEIGYGSATPGMTYAASTTGYKEGQITAAGTNFASLLKKLGAPT